MERKRLIIDLPPETLKTLAKEGINHGKSRKTYIEWVLEDKANKLNKKNNE